MSILFNKQPQILNVELAELIGLNESIVFQQIHYWLEINRKAEKNLRDGRFWTFNTFENWQKGNFSYWSEKTVKRIFKKLEDRNLIITGNYNKKGYDRTKWYTINYEKLESLQNSKKEPENLENTHKDKMTQWDKNIEKSLTSLENTHKDNLSLSSGQNDPMHRDKMTRPIPEIKKENLNRDILKDQVKSSQVIDDEEKYDLTRNDKIVKNNEIEDFKKEKEMLKQQKEIEELKAQIKELKTKEQKENINITDIHKYEFYKEKIEENIKYSWIQKFYSDNTNFLGLCETFVHIIVNNMANSKEKINISKEKGEISRELFKKQMESLDNSQFMYSVNQYMEYAKRTKISKPEGYIIACVYNALSDSKVKEFSM